MSYDFSFSNKSVILIIVGCIAVGVLLFFAGFIIGLDRGQNDPTVRASVTGHNQSESKTESEKGTTASPSENPSAPQQEQPSATASEKPAAEKSKEASAAEGKSSAAPKDAKSAAPKEGDAKDKEKEKDKFSVQLGAFQTEDNALRLRDNFKAKGYPVFLFRVLDGDGHVWHTVRMGHYADMKEASQAAEKITNREQVSAWVRPANAF
jgi:cell division septation protein DedD